MSGSTLDHLMSLVSGNLTKALAHIERLESVHRKFSTEQELRAAVQRAVETGMHIDSHGATALRSFLTQHKLLGGAKVGVCLCVHACGL